MYAAGSYTILQQTEHDGYVTEALIGIGALARACKETPSGAPLHLYCRSGGFKNDHHRKAIQHYNKALTEAKRSLITARPEKQIMVTLISGLLFHLFEWFHGNPTAVDQVTTLMMGILRDQAWAKSEPVQRTIKGALFMSNNSMVFQRIAPHFPLIKQHIWDQPDITSFHLPSAPGPERSLQEFVAVWWRFLSSIANLYIQPAFLGRGSPAQISFLLAAVASWEKEAPRKATLVDTPHSRRLLFTMATIAGQISERIQACARSPWTKDRNRGNFVALSIIEYTSLLGFYKLARVQQIDHEYAFVTEAMNHPALPTLVYVGRHCPRQALRLEALDLCRSLLQPVACLTMKETYMALRALAEVEGDTFTNCYAWTSSCWNDDYTALNVTLNPVDPAADHELPVRRLVLSVSDYGV